MSTWPTAAQNSADRIKDRRLWAATEQDKRSPIYTALVRERRYNPLASR